VGVSSRRDVSLALDGRLHRCRLRMRAAGECRAPTAEGAQWQRHGPLQWWRTGAARRTQTDRALVESII